MSNEFDYDIEIVLASDLKETDVLVGDLGGLSAIYEIKPSSIMTDMLAVETEHGFLYLDPDCEYAIVKRSSKTLMV